MLPLPPDHASQHLGPWCWEDVECGNWRQEKGTSKEIFVAPEKRWQQSSGWIKTISPTWPKGLVLPLILLCVSWTGRQVLRTRALLAVSRATLCRAHVIKMPNTEAFFLLSVLLTHSTRALWARLESYWEMPFFKRTKFCIPGESVREIKCTNWYWQSMRWDRDKTLHSTYNPLKTPHL